MSLLWMDGFDHYDGVVGNLALAGYTNASNVSLVTNRARTGSYCLRGGATSTGEIIRPLPSSLQTIGIAGAFWFGSMGTREIFEFIQSDGSLSTPNCTISYDSTGRIRFSRQSYAGPLLGQSAPGVITQNAWNHIEARVVISNTIGACQIRVNGVEVLNTTNVDSLFTGLELCPAVRIALPGSSTGDGYAYLDDLFIWDTSGSQNNNFLGDRKVTTLNLTDNTAVSEWGYTGAASPVQCINGTQDGDTSYIYAGSSVPVTSEFEFANADGTIGLIAGVQTVNVMRKVEAGTVIVQPSLVSGGSATDNGSHSVGDNYAYFNMMHQTNPATGMPWTASALNSARLRLRRTT